MLKKGRAAMLVSGILVVLACQGCAGLVMSDEPSAAPTFRINDTVDVSEGIRLATSGIYRGDVTSSLATGGAAMNWIELVEPGSIALPSVSASVTYIADQPMPRPWIAATSGQGGKSILSETEWSGTDALVSLHGRRDAARLIQPIQGSKDFSAQFDIGATREQTGLAFDVNLVPSVTYREEGKLATRRVGAEIRFGRELDQRGKTAVADSWYIFAGADGEALIWETGESGVVALRDQVTVGDLQAGISIERGGGQLSLSYIRREVSWGDRTASASRDEDFAGISFTLRR